MAMTNVIFKRVNISKKFTIFILILFGIALFYINVNLPAAIDSKGFLTEEQITSIVGNSIDKKLISVKGGGGSEIDLVYANSSATINGLWTIRNILDIPDDNITSDSGFYTGSILCNNIFGGTNSDYCIAAAGGNTSAEISQAINTSGFNTSYGEITNLLNVSGEIEQTHTATQSDDHAIEIDVNAAGFGDVKAIDIVYITGAITLGLEEEAILIIIDQFLSIGGEVFGIEILTTEGGADVWGMKVGIQIGPIEQQSGVFGDMDNASVNDTDVLTEFLSTTIDIDIFVSDNDNVTIGNAEKFEELEFLFNRTSSQTIQPIFWFSTQAENWTTFSPTDGTNGMRNNGLIDWDDSDIPDWNTSLNGDYLIRIQRTRNNIPTLPIEDKVQISSTTPFYWNKHGDLQVNDVNGTVLNFTNIIAGNLGVGTSTPSSLVQINDSGTDQPTLILTVNTTNISCNATYSGAISYMNFGSGAKHYGCNGTGWNALY